MRRTDRDLPLPPNQDRPNRAWLCGQLGEAKACDNGPDAHGHCPLRGVCRPKRTWQGKRRPWLVCSFLIASVVVGVALLGPIHPSWIKPGELSSPHAQILSGTVESDRCSTCHTVTTASAIGWFFSAGAGHDGVDQSERCLNCHHTLAPTSLARSAHNTPSEVRDQIRLASTATQSHPRVAAADQDAIACSVCHQEHHGAQADLRLVADSKCQSCHASSFSNFSTDHPDWSRWPYGRGGEIAFNHATHEQKHFPGSQVNGSVAGFQCSQCHEQNSANEITRTRSYEVACAACHDQPLAITSGEGIELVSIPMLPRQLASQQSNWPAQATGFLDGNVSPIAELLLSRDAEFAEAIRTLPTRNFSDVNLASTAHRDAAAAIARGAQSLLQEIANRGQGAIETRARAAGVRSAALRDFVHAMPPQLIADTLERWFNASPVVDGSAFTADPDDSLSSPSDQMILGDNRLGDDLINDDLIGGDLLATSDAQPVDPLLSSVSSVIDASRLTESPRFDAPTMMPAGGWYRDDVRMSIRYRGVSHADSTLRALIEMVAVLGPDDPVSARVLALPAIKSCVDCHPSGLASEPVWTSLPRVGRTDEFTKFSHAPHVNVAKLADCKHCHQVASTSSIHRDSMASVAAVKVSLASHPGDDSEETRHGHDFLPLSRAACVACHTPELASDACTTCHRYHIR